MQACVCPYTGPVHMSIHMRITHVCTSVRYSCPLTCLYGISTHISMHIFRHCARAGTSADIFLQTFRRMPTASAEGGDQIERCIGKVSVRRVFGYLQIDTGPRRSPAAPSEIFNAGAQARVPVHPVDMAGHNFLALLGP